MSATRNTFLDQLSKYGHIPGLKDDLAKIEAKHTAAVQARATVEAMAEALKSAREWHLGDKWRGGDEEQRFNWQLQLARYDDALARFHGTTPPATDAVDGWKAMTEEARSMMLRHLANHTGDVYHALQSLVVSFGYRSNESMIVDHATPPAGGGDAPSFWFIEQPGNDGGWWAGGTRFDLTKDPNKAVRFPSRQAAEKFIAIFGAAWADCIATEHGWIDSREMEEVRREVQEARLAPSGGA